jgi:hypothetical protein
LQFGADLELHFRTLIGTGQNPNVAAVVVICIEDQWAKKVADAIAETGKPVAYFGIEQHGDHDTIMRASQAAKKFVQWASEQRREERPLKDLWVSTKCGESDTTSGCGANPTVGNAFDKLYDHGVTMCFGETTELTGGEHLVAARCRTPEVRKKFQYMFDRYQAVVEAHKTSDLRDSQPTKGNIAGGLTTIEEKALGNIQKIGRKCLIDGVLDKHEEPTGPGLWFIDSSSAAGRDGHPLRRCRLHRALLPDGPGQRDRQSDPAGDQALRQSAHGAHDERAHRRGCLGAPAQGDDPGPGRRCAARLHVPHRQRKAHGRRGAGASGIRAHAAVRERVNLLVSVWRGGTEGRFQSFEVPRQPSQTVLDVVTHIQRHLDPTLSYRFACRVGMCGSCAMMVNGTPRWTCRTHVDKVARKGALELAPLANLPVVKDLVADMREFFDKWARARGQFGAKRHALR